MNLEVDAAVAAPGAILVAHAVVEHQSHQRVLRCLSKDQDQDEDHVRIRIRIKIRMMCQAVSDLT